jgi:hypothetical protein
MLNSIGDLKKTAGEFIGRNPENLSDIRDTDELLEIAWYAAQVLDEIQMDRTHPLNRKAASALSHLRRSAVLISIE